jgi:glutamate/tyrosine decarboxylase-like PLP-dependent enzyme
VLANLSALVAAPQRVGIHAFNYLEEISLQWLAEMFELPTEMKGVYSSGGSVANLVALGAARQWAFEKIGVDPAAEGITHVCRIYATQSSHRTIHRAAAILGMGRDSVVTIESDHMGRMIPDRLEQQLAKDAEQELVAIAVVANAGTTSTGAIDPIGELGRIAKKYSVWFHVDGAYGLPGILDPRLKQLYKGLSLADSVIVDPHKWLGAPVGIGATFVRDRSILYRAFTQGASDYLEGSCSTTEAKHSMDNLGIPYHDFGVELSAPSRGVVVWALIREIGKQGLAERVMRHNDMARQLAERVEAHPSLELVQQPTLSICCFRYIDDNYPDLNELNTRIHRQLVHNNHHIPSTVVVDGKFAIRPCYIGARAIAEQVDSLVDEVLTIGEKFTSDDLPKNKLNY